MRRLLAAALMLSAGSAFAEPLVVIESTIPALALGAAIDGDTPLSLPEKSRVVMVSESGRTIALSGPWQGKPAAGGGKGGEARLVTAMASLVRTTQEDIQSVGAIRATGIKTRADALMVNLSESGDYCVAEPNTVDITRYAVDKGPSITVNAVKGDLKATLAWPGKADRTRWPAEIALEDGATYLVEQAGKDTRTMIVVHFVADNHATDAHRAVFMAEKGCMEQAKMLLALLRKG